MKNVLIVLVLLMGFCGPVNAEYNESLFNTSNATKSIDNLYNYNITYRDISSYPGLNKLSLVEHNNTTAMLDVMFMPINAYWLDSSVMGSWLYVVLIILTAGITYIKTKQLETTSLVILMFALLVAAPGVTGVLIVPAAMLHLMYICIVLGIVGIFGGLFMGGSQ
jgi:hypothetical protein